MPQTNGTLCSMPTRTTLIGYIASGLVLTTFWTNDLRRLRILAILSNIAFISYGALVWLPPVLGLHLLLLPLNTVRLMGMPRAAPGAAQRELLAPRLAMLVDRARRSPSAGSGLRCEPRTSSRTLLSPSSSAFASFRSGVPKPSVNQP